MFYDSCVNISVNTSCYQGIGVRRSDLYSGYYAVRWAPYNFLSAFHLALCSSLAVELAVLAAIDFITYRLEITQSTFFIPLSLTAGYEEHR